MTIEDVVLNVVRGIIRQGIKRPHRNDITGYLSNRGYNTETINRTLRKMINERKTLIEYKHRTIKYLMIPTQRLAKEHKGTLEDYFQSEPFLNDKRTHTARLSQ